MDERKGFIRTFLKILFWIGILILVSIGSYGGIIYYQTQTIKDPSQCLVSKMYEVNLCPSNRNYVAFKGIPKHFFQALILSEDASFYSHQGFDWAEIKESFRRNFVEWKFARGGSTLTQQLAKNLYLSKEKSVSRKFKEFFIARQIEKKLSKSQILEKYANVVEFGEKIYGLKPATQYYFNKTPNQLNVLESVYLVSLLPSPVRLGKSFQKQKLSRDNIWRMKIILERMYRTGKINDELFVYLKMLMEDSDWPFNQYTDGMFEPMSIEDQLFQEFEGLDERDPSLPIKDEEIPQEADSEQDEEPLPPLPDEDDESSAEGIEDPNGPVEEEKVPPEELDREVQSMEDF